ncbi:uncharacterized protein FFNC_15680 [Fusarium fujikuroi]|nr:uncharacterized protein FFNC_15680 [Fusarium fujikuroi]
MPFQWPFPLLPLVQRSNGLLAPSVPRLHFPSEHDTIQSWVSPACQPLNIFYSQGYSFAQFLVQLVWLAFARGIDWTLWIKGTNRTELKRGTSVQERGGVEDIWLLRNSVANSRYSKWDCPRLSISSATVS